MKSFVEAYVHKSGADKVYWHPGDIYREEILRRVVRYYTILGYTDSPQVPSENDLNNLFQSIQDDYDGYVRNNLHQR